MEAIQAHLTISVKHPYTEIVKNAYMKSIGERIAERLAELKASGTPVEVMEVAKAADVSRQAVYMWLSGDSKSLKSENLIPVATLLGVRERWLESGRGPKLRTGTADLIEMGVPVVGTAQLGDDGYWLETGYPVGQGEGFVHYPTRDKNTYALRVKGDSMRPRIKPGEFVVIEPSHGYVHGDEVMVKTLDGRCMVKVYGHHRAGSIELLSINEDHRPITVEEAQVEKIHYVGGILKSSLYYEGV